MKKPAVWCVLLAELLILLCGCQTAAPVEDSPAPQSVSVSRPQSQPEQSQPEPETRTAVLCINYIGHPILRIVQRGFSDSAQQLGYEWHVVGLADGSSEQMHAEWLRGVEQYDADGALCWVGDDSGYEFLKELHGMGVKIAVPYFPHAYSQTKEFIDVNVHQDYDAAAIETADFIVKALAEKGIRSGDVGISVPGTPQPAGLQTFRDYMRKTYPEYNILEEVYESAELPAATAKVEALLRTSPDLVAGFGLSGYSAQVWAAAKESTGRRDVVVVGYDYTTENLDVLSGGGVDALISQPLYEAGAEGLALLDQMFCGKVYSTSETVWKQPLDMPLIYPGGVGVHDPARCHDLYKRAQARFGDCT